MIAGRAGAVATAFATVRDRIAEAASRAGRDPGQVKLIAVSKGKPPEVIVEGVKAGQFDYGENRVQEAVWKQQEVGGHGEIAGRVRWHFVGRLQRNKVKKLVHFVDTIHSIDSVPLAAEVQSRASSPLKVLVEVNVAGEPQKGGVSPRNLPALVEAILEMPRLDLIGLMTIAPRTEDPEEVRPVFSRLARLREETAARFSSPRIRHLSMGMSQDYVVAVEEGATMLRIGEAVFGPRDHIEPAFRAVRAQGSGKVSP